MDPSVLLQPPTASPQPIPSEPISPIPTTPLKPKSKLLCVLVISILLLLLASVGFLAHNNWQLKLQISQIQSMPTPQITPSTTPDPTANWKTYQDTTHGFSIKYPNNWTVLPGGGVNPWININSPDVGPKGSQEPHIGMSVSIQLFSAVKQIEDNDLKQLVSDEGILKHFKVNIIAEGFLTIQNHKLFKYEYEGNEQSYLFHYWGMNIANDKTIISLLVTDFKEDKSLNTQRLANQILSTFKFLNPNAVSDNCVNEKDSILATINTFENLQKNKDPKRVLAFFTPPQSPEDISNYQSLNGENAQISPRLYNNVSTSYNTISYSVTKPPTKLSEVFCTVTVEEQRSNYGGPANPQYLPTQTDSFILYLVKVDGSWKIDQYQSENTKIKRGKYAGFLMEYLN